MIGALPIILQYGIPLLTYGIGHLIGWLHGRHSAKKGGLPNVEHP